MKKLNLDTIDKHATFFMYAVNKYSFDLAISYNVLSTGMAQNYPMAALEQRLANDFPEMYSNLLTLETMLQAIESEYNMTEDFRSTSEILANIKQSLIAIGTPPIQQENQTKFISRALVLLGLIFADLQKVEKEFTATCKQADINYNHAFDWTDDEPIDLSVESEIPSEETGF